MSRWLPKNCYNCGKPEIPFKIETLKDQVVNGVSCDIQTMTCSFCNYVYTLYAFPGTNRGMRKNLFLKEYIRRKNNGKKRF